MNNDKVLIQVNGTKILVSKKMVNYIQIDKKHCENTTTMNDIENTLKRIDEIYNICMTNKNRISNVINELNEMKKMEINVENTIHELEMQSIEYIEKSEKINKSKKTIINELYNKLYNKLCEIAKYYTKLLSVEFDDSVMIKIFDGYTDDKNKPTIGHYKKSVILDNQMDYTMENCKKLNELIENSFILINVKTESIDEMISNTNKDIKKGYRLESMLTSLVKKKDEIKMIVDDFDKNINDLILNIYNLVVSTIHENCDIIEMEKSEPLMKNE
jgi:hypothetical protein